MSEQGGMNQQQTISHMLYMCSQKLAEVAQFIEQTEEEKIDPLFMFGQVTWSVFLNVLPVRIEREEDMIRFFTGFSEGANVFGPHLAANYAGMLANLSDVLTRMIENDAFMPEEERRERLKEHPELLEMMEAIGTGSKTEAAPDSGTTNNMGGV